MHRNSQKRFYNRNNIYFITTKTKWNFSYFSEPIFCDLFLEELRLVKKIKQTEVFAFCVIPDHVHLLVRCRGKYTISEFMQSLKKNFSQDANKIIENMLEGGNSNSRLHKVDIKKFQNQFIFKYGIQPYEFRMFQWQSSFHDHVIRGERDFKNHFNYCVYNFQKHNLPHDWTWTSLNFPEEVD